MQRHKHLTEGYKLQALNSNLQHHAVGDLNMPQFLEFVLVMYRRMMIGCIQDPGIQVVAVLLTALEEALARSTLVIRDKIVAAFFGRRELSVAE